MDEIIRRRVTEALGDYPQGGTVSEIARRASLTRNRVLTALEALGREGLAGRVEIMAPAPAGYARKVQGWKPAGKATKRPRPALRGGLEGSGPV